MRQLLGLALCLVAACSTGQVADEDNPFRPSYNARGGEIEVFVDNLNFADATLTAIHQGGRQRLGIVGGKDSSRFTLPWPGVRDLRVRIDLLAADSYTTAPLSVSPGDRVRLTIETVLRRSQLIR